MQTVAIAICTHNREKHLVECLKSLKKLNKPANCKIIIAVIDSSDKKLPSRYRKLTNIYIHNKKSKPLSVKRNIAAKKIKADIIAFTDDDCIPEKNWLKELIKEFSNNNIVCVTGRTITHPKYRKTTFEKLFSFDNLGTKRKCIKKHLGLQNLWRFGHGNNMAFRTELFQEIGLFNPNLGVGSKGYAGEDVDMFYRIYKAGYTITHNPQAIIYHKHITKDQDLAKWAYKNNYASHLVLWKHHDLNTLTLYKGGITKLTLKTILSYIANKKPEKNINLQALRGWLGIKPKGTK